MAERNALPTVEELAVALTVHDGSQVNPVQVARRMDRAREIIDTAQFVFQQIWDMVDTANDKRGTRQ